MANIIVNPANLVGKLHQAAVDKVNEKYSNDIEIFNTAVNVANSKEPLAIVKDGKYKIICYILKKNAFREADDLINPIDIYLRQFAGTDVARAFRRDSKVIDLIEQQLNDGKTQIEVPYEIQVKSGAKQSEKTVISQQQADAASSDNSEIVDLGDVTASDT